MSYLKCVYCFIIFLLSAINFLFSENKGDISKEEIILTLKAADCYKTELDSNEVYWFGYFHPGTKDISNRIDAFAVDKKGWIYISQIIHNERCWFQEKRPSELYRGGLRIQVFDNHGHLRKITHIHLPDSVETGVDQRLLDLGKEDTGFRSIGWGYDVDQILVDDNGSYFLRCLVCMGRSVATEVILKLSSEGEVERIWGPNGNEWIAYLRSNWDYHGQGYVLGYTYFTERGYIKSGKLIFNKNGRLLNKDENYLSNVRSHKYIIQAIDKELYSLDYHLGVSKITTKDGRTLIYDVHANNFLYRPFEIFDNAELVIYRAKKSFYKGEWDSLRNFYVYLDKNGEVDPYVYIVREKYYPVENIDFGGELYKSVFYNYIPEYSPANIDTTDLPKDIRHAISRYIQRSEKFSSQISVPKVTDFPEEVIIKKQQAIERAIVSSVDRDGVDRDSIEDIALKYTTEAVIAYEWEGMSDGPLDEAKFAEDFLRDNPDTPIKAYLYLFLMHRYRCAFECFGYEKNIDGQEEASSKYQQNYELANEYHTPVVVDMILIRLIADDIDKQPYLYIKTEQHPRNIKSSQ